MKRSVFCVVLCLAIGPIACGKKGPPLAPLRLVPEPAANLTARRLGSTVYLQMSVPSKNANGPGPLALDHLEIYAVTAAAGAPPPANRELLSTPRLIGRIEVKPPVTDDEAPAEEAAPKDTRPGPGDTVTFTETLTEVQLKPQILPPAKGPGAAKKASDSTAGSTTAETPVTPLPNEPPSTPATPPPVIAVPAAGGTSVGGTTAPLPSPASPSTPSSTTAASAPSPSPPVTTAAATAAPAPAITVPTRIYVVRGVTKRGRSGAPSARMTVPLIPPPPVATGLATSFSETAVTLTWLPPILEIGSTRMPLGYNVYAVSSSTEPPEVMPKPLNEKPLEMLSYEHADAKPGNEQCFVVRTVATVASTMVESEPSARACITPRDIFPPAAPKGLTAVAGPGAINLIWDANTEGDLAGYLVLRAEAPSDTLQPLSNEPTRETRYRDTTVKPGIRYVYAIVAIDRAANHSTPSARIEETAR